MHKIGGAHLQCVNNHYAKFETQTRHPLGISDETNSKSNKRKK